MLSSAGKNYNRTKIVSPYNTRQRWNYNQLEPVKSPRQAPKPYQTLDVNLRQNRDSFLLRYNKDITTGTNHSPNYSTIQISSPRQGFLKGAFQRYIGDVRKEDFSIPLPKDCNHRCAKANNQQKQDLPVTASSKLTTESYLKMRQPSSSSENKELKQLESSLFDSLNLKKLELSDLKSTQPSVIKDRSRKTVSLRKERPQARPRRLKGLNFSSSIGHKYLQQVDDKAKEQIPEFYDLVNSKQSLIKKSFKQPRIHIQFGSFRKSISTRYDRADPDWHLSMDTSNCQLVQKDLSYAFNYYSSRQPNVVKSKYPHRASMNLYEFPTKESLI